MCMLPTVPFWTGGVIGSVEVLAQTRLLRRATSLPPPTLCFVDTALRRGLTRSHAALLGCCAALCCCAIHPCPPRLASSPTRGQRRGKCSLLLLRAFLRTSCHWWQLVRYNHTLRARTSVAHALSCRAVRRLRCSARLRLALRRRTILWRVLYTWLGVLNNTSSGA